MSELYLFDNMKKEARIQGIVSIIMLLFFTTGAVVKGTELFPIKHYIVLYILAFMCLYGCIYGNAYQLQIRKDCINLKYLFGKHEMQVSAITGYTCKKSAISFYQFKLFSKEKKLIIQTHYREKVIRFLNDSGIEKIN